MKEFIMAPEEAPVKKGKLKPTVYGSKILTIYRKCSCGGKAGSQDSLGSVVITKNPDGNGNTATCTACGATIKFSGTWTLENQDTSDLDLSEIK
jgi:hypothetical protein